MVKREETKDKNKWPFFTMRKVTSGIPQESVLRSVLLIFMKDLEKVANNKMTKCAEDTFLFRGLYMSSLKNSERDLY